jgi:hypothetical protein
MARAKRPPPRRAADDDNGNGAQQQARGVVMSPAMMQAMQAMMGRGVQVPTMKKGGVVPKTGMYRMHKGERVIPARTATPAKKR